MKRNTQKLLIGIGCIVLLLAVAGTAGVQAKGIPWKNDLFFDIKPFPVNYGSEKEMVEYIRKNHHSEIAKSKEGPTVVYFIAFVKQIKDPEVYFLVFDVTKRGQKEFVQRYTKGGAQDQTILQADIKLESELFQSGHKYLLVLKSRSQGELAKEHLSLK